MLDNQDEEKYEWSTKQSTREYKTSLWGHEYSSLVFVVCRGGSCLCEGMISRSEESCRVCVCVIWKSQLRGGLGPCWAVAPREGGAESGLCLIYFSDFYPFLYFRFLLRQRTSKQWLTVPVLGVILSFEVFFLRKRKSPKRLLNKSEYFVEKTGLPLSAVVYSLLVFTLHFSQCYDEHFSSRVCNGRSTCTYPTGRIWTMIISASFDFLRLLSVCVMWLCLFLLFLLAFVSAQQLIWPSETDRIENW